ncbi:MULTISPECIES: zinc-dependent alcohol dehydrogenase family protein [Kitasatospora]|uniref:Putative alcohol dehydrogenase n=1 Tax=Kitasatospora setae (strain ATCC 33774 / DSM 43861 / JCM 3304 / KCC A-0304 / NBRC 14216 / KM-6054) TaxID=452652 RepID=E4N0E3_KITSK|nr:MULTISPECIES: zinc-dependent alcohol dehydrogenase family protein [Kitasatospora]BAJ31471.1 putative alcohol dehydrogenase [Kitasatospora setae KM-6054]
MRATVIHGPQDIRIEEVPDPRIERPTDVVVRVLNACICGSDLWAYRGVAKRQAGQRIGHEFLGFVEEAGAEVRGFAVGDLVVAPFVWSDGVCEYCREGLQTSCPHGGFWGTPGSDGGQGEAVRVPYADGTLVKLPKEAAGDEKLLPGLLALSDVMATGHHAAVSAGVRPGATVAVVGDGAVGLCGVLAAHRLGAGRIIALGRHEGRTAIARSFGATDVVPERGEAAVEAVRELTGGQGAHAVLEAVGTEESMRTALSIARDGGAVGYVGVPHGGSAGVDIGQMFNRNVRLVGGVAPARAYIPELLPDVLSGAIAPGAVFDRTVDLDGVPEGYRAMDERTALKVRIAF